MTIPINPLVSRAHAMAEGVLPDCSKPPAFSFFFRRNGCEVGFLFERHEPSFSIVGHRSRIVQRACVQPNSIGSVAPGLLSSDGQEMFPQTSAEELLKQTEVRDLY